jgi:DNA-directed RNA polymerase subunit RPC12/RpoP
MKDRNIREGRGVMKEDVCANCQGENAKTGHVETQGGVCPDCGRIVNELEAIKETLEGKNAIARIKAGRDGHGF